MGNIKIIRGVFDTILELEHANVVAGFPSPADDTFVPTEMVRRLYEAKSSKKELWPTKTLAKIASKLAKKYDFKSPNPTTRWSDIIKLK